MFNITKKISFLINEILFIKNRSGTTLRVIGQWINFLVPPGAGSIPNTW